MCAFFFLLLNCKLNIKNSKRRRKKVIESCIGAAHDAAEAGRGGGGAGPAAPRRGGPAQRQAQEGSTPVLQGQSESESLVK